MKQLLAILLIVAGATPAFGQTERPPAYATRFTVRQALILPSTTSAILKTNAQGIVDAAVDGTDYLSPAAIDDTVQGFDADLSSWAAVTRAAGLDTFVATPSSANLAALITDETGTGALVFGTSPTLTTPTISGTVTWPDNVRQTFNPGANAAGLNVGAHASDPDTPINGDLYYNSTADELRARIDGSWVALSTGGSSHDAVTLAGEDYLSLTGQQITADAINLATSHVTGTLPVANGGTGITSFGTGVASALGANTTGSGGLVRATSPTLTTPNLGTPSAVTLTNATGLPVGSGISGLGSNVATWLATPSSANLASAVTDESGSGALIFGTSPTIGTPTLTNPTISGTTTSAAGQIGFNATAWASGRGAVQVYDGTANTYLIGVLASDTPTAGQVPKWNADGTITWEADTSGAGGVSDGDKGDITVSDDGDVWTIDANVVDLSNLQQIDTSRLLGRFTAGTGNVESLTISANVQSLLGAADYAAMKGLLDLEIGTDVQAYDADLTTWAGISPSANIQTFLGAADFASARDTLGVEIGADVQAYNANLTTYAGIAPSANIQTLLGSADFAAARSNLGLVIGTDVQAYDADLTTWAGIAPSANIQTFLGSADYSAARTNLGVAIGSNVQAWDADLDTYAGITPSANVQSFLGASNYAGMRSQLDLEVGTDVQAYDADLAALAGVTSAADKVPYFTGSGTATVTDLTSFARTILDDSSAATARATLEAAPAGTAVLITDTATQTRYQAASDSDAARGTALVNAQTAAAAGDTIIVGPGNYTISTALGKDGVNWHLMPGVVITTSSGISIFTDGGSAMTFTISGGGVIRGNAEYGVYTGHADSNIAIQCRSIESTNNAAVRANAGKISIVATERIYSGTYDGLWSSGGTIYCYVPTIAAANNAIEVTQAGSVYVRAETIGYGDEPIYFDGNGSGVGFVSCQRIVLQNLAIAIHSDGMSNSVVVCPHIQGQVNHLGGVLRVVGGKLGMIGGTAATVRVVDNGLTLENCQIDSPSGASESIDADSTTPTVTIIGSLTHNKAIDAGVTLTYSTASNYLAQIKTVDGNGSGLDADLVRGTTPSTAGLDILDIANGTDGQFLKSNGDGSVAWDSPSGSGDVTAASSFGTDNRIIRSDGTGKGVQASGITLDDSNNLTGIGDVTADGLTLNDLTASRIVVTDGSKVLTSGAAAPSGAFVGTTDTQTLTNKRITPRVTTISSSATPTINTDDCDVVTITALAANITSMTTNLSGTPSNFDKLIIRIKDDGTPRTISWGASFASYGATLPTTTTTSKVHTIGFIYDSVASKWGCVAATVEP